MGILSGKAWLFGDHVDTDAIIPARYCNTIDPVELGSHAMAGLDPGFAGKVTRGDIVVGGENFGCGSSRETAPIALLGAGIGAVVAVSFGRIFFRNCINVGLPIFESSQAAGNCREGDQLSIFPEDGRLVNETLGASYQLAEYPRQILDIIEAGGMVPYVRRRLGLPPQ
ncbi:MAG: 3-isopropylmalate dehydratase small subunit [Acidobacteriota bacterium]|jgi:3-isopropylmalate/(R)-2-methylmalate dehydratase small subunit